MGRKPCCSEEELNRGAWTAEEDRILKDYITSNGSEGRWRSLPKKAGLKRCGKSCRLRWLNYLRPDIKRGNITLEEEDLIIRLHKLLGNRWSLIAGRLPGRTDNEIKNYWNTYLRKKIQNQHQTEEAVRLPAMGLHQNADLHAGVSSGEAIKELPMKADEWWDGLSEGWLDAGHAAATAAAPAQKELTSVDYLYMSVEKGYDGSGHVGEGLLGMEVLGASDCQLGGDDEKLFGWWSLADEISQVWEW